MATVSKADRKKIHEYMAKLTTGNINRNIVQGMKRFFSNETKADARKEYAVGTFLSLSITQEQHLRENFNEVLQIFLT